jgi:hypothetical protein
MHSTFSTEHNVTGRLVYSLKDSFELSPVCTPSIVKANVPVAAPVLAPILQLSPDLDDSHLYFVNTSPQRQQNTWEVGERSRRAVNTGRGSCTMETNHNSDWMHVYHSCNGINYTLNVTKYKCQYSSVHRPSRVSSACSKLCLLCIPFDHNPSSSYLSLNIKTQTWHDVQ